MSQGELSVKPAARRAGTQARDNDERWVWAVVAVWWALLGVRLATAWSASVEQAHGWAVPLFVAYFVVERGRKAGARARPAGPARVTAWLAVAAGAAVAGATLPVLEANRLWPTAQWAGWGGVALATAGWLALAGGWAWSRRFWFPWLFATTALTWPTAVQVPLMAGLARANAVATAEVVSWFGHPAVARGNIIEVGTGFVGVDEACSGLRSLQAVWMLGWLLGEVLALRWRRRIALVAIALAVAVIGNLARTVFLTTQVALAGTSANERWHDPAGAVAMVATLLVVAGVAYGLSRDTRSAEETRGEQAPGNWPVGRRAAIAALVVGMGIELGTRGWFTWHRVGGSGRQWAIAEGVPDWAPAEIPARTQEILRASSGEGRQWHDASGARQALAYVFRWENDTAVGMEARRHDPTACMPSVGARLEARLPDVELTLAERRLPFRAFRFRAEGTTQHVFFCVWDAFANRPAPAEPENEVLPSYRWARVREGRARADVAQVIFVLQGEADDAAAVVWLRAQAPRLLVEK